MQKCPKCGYNEGVDWPTALMIASCSALYIAFLLGTDEAPKGLRMFGLASYLVFSVGTAWKASRKKRAHDEYLRLHPGPAERLKAHIKPDTPANSH